MRRGGRREVDVVSVGEVISEMKIGGRLGGRGRFLRARTSGVIVAVKRRVRREVEGGSAEMQVLRSESMEPGPEASSLSASSSTTALALLSPIVVSAPEVCMWSASRPGVATTMCGRDDNAEACGRISLPPVISATLRDCGAPIARNCSYIWRASSRVGVRMTAYIPNGSCDHFCSIGTAKATVLPVPVLEPPMQSLPFSISGIHDSWISVGLEISIDLRLCTSHGDTSSDSKVELVVGVDAEAGRSPALDSSFLVLRVTVDCLILEGAL